MIVQDVASQACFSAAIDKYPETGRAAEKPSAGIFRSRGCYTDSIDARALTGGSTQAGDMTVEKCVEFARGNRYAGLEYNT